jgi:ubiquinone/menaquinone biosynthesis C-methylase UbiE
MKALRFVCPACKGSLSEVNGSYLCRTCGSEWKIKGNIPMFTKEPFYWDGMAKKDVVSFNNFAKEVGWREAIKSRMKEEGQSYLFDESRANWKYLIESNINGKILDAGCGRGTLSFALSKHCEAVYALDATWERVEFAQIRKEQDKVDNLRVIYGNILSLPFPDDYFDVVIMNGLLEWVALSDVSSRPDKVQEAALRSVLRVLKPGGSVYVGIENRLAFFYFLGVRDPHNKLRFATLMPKSLANVYSRMAGKGDYRTYIYSIRGYRKLFTRSGFNDISFYMPIPGYHYFKYMVPLRGAGIFRYWASRILYYRVIFSPFAIRFLYALFKAMCLTPLKRLFMYLVPDLSIIAVKENEL